MEMPFSVVSLSHFRAPVDIRELIYLPEQSCRDLLISFRDSLGIREAMIFSTCNRTEVYYRADTDLSEEIIKMLCIEKGVERPERFIPYFHVITEEEEALIYLFEVSMGLHSHILGDLQIANQVKQAYVWANDAEMAGAYLHRLMHTIFHTNKRVHQETPYRDGAASVSYAAAELTAALTNHLEAPRVLVVGLGEMGRDVALNLDLNVFGQVHLMNRTFSKAQKLAAELGVEAVPFEEFEQRLPHYDAVVSAVSVKEPLITAELVENLTTHSQVVIDLCVPRSVAREVEALSHILLYNIDEINSRTAKVLARREQAIPQVKEIIQTELSGFLEWRTQLSISPTIHRIKGALEKIRKEELARYLKHASEEESELLDSVTRSMINKILKMPVLQLKEACKRGDPEGLIDVINELFNLEQEKKRQQQ